MARFSSSGARVGTDTRLTIAHGASHSPTINWTGTDYIVAWGDNRAAPVLGVNRFDPAGVAIDTETLIPASFAALQPIIVAEPGGFRIAYVNLDGANNQDLYYLRIDANLDLSGGPFGLSTTGEHSGVSLAFNGTQFALGYEYALTGLHRTYVHRFGLSGGSLGQTTLTSIAQFELPGYTSVAWDGTAWAFAWDESRTVSGLYFRRVATDGTMASPETVRVSHSAGVSAPSLIATPSGYALAWVDRRDGNDEIYFAKLDPSGALATPAIRVTNTPNNAFSPILVDAGGRFAIAWGEELGGYNADMFVATLDCP